MKRRTIDDIDKELEALLSFTENGGGFGDFQAQEAHERKIQTLLTLRQQELLYNQNESIGINNESEAEALLDKQTQPELEVKLSSINTDHTGANQKEVHNYKITRYTLEEYYTGHGASGMVFKARDISAPFELYRAIKIHSPHPFSSGAHTKERFEREVESISKLKHNSVVGFISCGYTEDESNLPYIVMEFIEGIPLGKAFPEMDFPQRVRAMIQVLEGLDYAHKNNVLHRDIKPNNIIYDNIRNNAVIVDFGLAYIWEGLTSETCTTQLIGSMGYIPPEVQSNPKLRDIRHDVYSCGITLYEIINGNKPNIQEIVPLVDISPEFKDLDPIVQKSLAGLTSRYQNASEFLIDLKKWYSKTYSGEDLYPDFATKIPDIDFKLLKQFLSQNYSDHAVADDKNILALMQYLEDLNYHSFDSIQEVIDKNINKYLTFEKEHLKKKDNQIVALVGTLAFSDQNRLVGYYPYAQELALYQEQVLAKNVEFSIQIRDLNPCYKFNISKMSDELVISPKLFNVGAQRISGVEVQCEIEGPYLFSKDFVFYHGNDFKAPVDCITLTPDKKVLYWKNNTQEVKVNPGQKIPLDLGDFVLRSESSIHEETELVFTVFVNELEAGLSHRVRLSKDQLPLKELIDNPKYRILRRSGKYVSGNVSLEPHRPIFTNEYEMQLHVRSETTDIETLKKKMKNDFCGENLTPPANGVTHNIKDFLFLRKTLIRSIFDTRAPEFSDLYFRANFFDFFENGIEVVKSGNHKFLLDENGFWQVIPPVFDLNKDEGPVKALSIKDGLILGRIPFKYIVDYNFDGDAHDQATVINAVFTEPRLLFVGDVYSTLEKKESNMEYFRLDPNKAVSFIPLKLDRNYREMK